MWLPVRMLTCHGEVWPGVEGSIDHCIELLDALKMMQHYLTDSFGITSVGALSACFVLYPTAQASASMTALA